MGEIAPGTIIGHYELEAPLGRGGMGVVYRARDLRLQRTVALKLLPDAAAGPRGGRGLLEEAQSAARLNHEHICTIYDVGETADGDRQGYIAMEYIDGVLLGDRLADGPLAPEDTVALAIQMAAALAHAHERGIIHGDLKPSNVMIVGNRRVKLLDFGLARRRDPAPGDAATEILSMTHSTAIAGTVPYMAPEMFRGQPSDVRTDVWAMGVVMYEMSTGRRPFGASTAWATVADILERPAPPLPPHIPAALGKVIDRCLQTDSRQRLQTALELGRELQAIAALPAGDDVPRARSAARRQARIRSIAVLPLDDLSPAPGQEHIAEGMTDALISMLSKVEPLRVVSRTSVMRYKASRKPLPEIAAELDVDAVVEGSVTREGTRLRVTARLIHARTDTPRWSETYDRRLHDILALQTELARAIVDGIKLKLTKRDNARLSAVARVDTAGYDAYLRGRYHWNRRTGDDLRKAIAAFREALARDPAYAPAYVGIADCLLTLVSYGLVAPRQAMPEMKSLVVKALALDSDLPEAHLACAMVNFYYDWDWVATERSLTRALKLNPRSAIAHLWHGLYLVTQGRTAESARAIARARELEPLSPAIGALSGWALHLGRKHEAAAELCLAMLELDPNFFLAHMSLAVALEEQSRYPEALSAMSTALVASRADQVGRTVIARLHARNGDMATARAMLEELVAAAATRYLSAYHVAAIHLALGEPDSAFEWLDRAYEDRALHMVTLNVDPAFDNLRGDARFAKLQQRLGWR